MRAGRPRRPRDRARRGADRRADGRLHADPVDPLEDVGGRARRHARAVPALHARRPRAGAEPRPPRRGGGLPRIVVTLDTQILGWRPRDLEQASFPQLRGLCLANYFTDPLFRAKLDKPPEEDPRAAALQWALGFSDPGLSWDDLDWLRSLTDLPLLLKGICHPDDVRRAVDAGVDGIYCSNHGGRQANGGAAAIDCLPGVVEAAAGDVPVLFDSGVRSGDHVVKALALGATAVGVGRPYAWGWRSAGGRHRARAALPARRNRPADGRRRLSRRSPT